MKTKIIESEMFKSIIEANDWELNKLAAEEIMDWHIGDKKHSGGYWNKSNQFQSELESWNPTGNRNDAFLLLDIMIKQGWNPILDYDEKDGGWLCVLCGKGLDREKAPNMTCLEVTKAITMTCLIAKLIY